METPKESPAACVASPGPGCSAVFRPTDRVMVFDHRLFKNDRDTPISVTVKPATVLRVYRTADRYYDLVMDVRFDHDGRESKGHFVDGAKLITPNPRVLGAGHLVAGTEEPVVGISLEQEEQ